MMKTILLLAFAVFVSSAFPKKDKNLLGELVDELNTALKTLPKETRENEIFLRELKTESSEHEFFCQAEQELVKEVSGRTKYDHFRTDKKLMRNLHMYNNHNGSTCEPVEVEFEEKIPLRKFLENLKKCVQKAYSQIKKN